MQNIEQIKLINLTEDDFKLIVDGLEALPEKSAAGELMMELIIHSMSKDEESMAKAKADMDARTKKRDRDKEIVKENAKILQGKLLMLKRYMQENKLLADAYDVISIPNRQ